MTKTKPNKGLRQTYTALVVAGMLHVLAAVQAYCPIPDSHERQDKFYKCVRNMDNSDMDGDDLLDPEEFETYVRAMIFSIFVVPPFQFKDSLPHELQHDLFDVLVNVSGNVVDENGDPRIDVFGSSIYELPLIDEDRMNTLGEICWTSVSAIQAVGPQTSAPKNLVLEKVKDQNKQANKMEDLDAFANILSIHSSFVLANFEGLEAHDLSIAQNSTIALAFGAFLLDLMDTECPNHNNYKHCWEDPYASYDEALDSEDGSLCGSHAEWVRRIFCETLRHRDLRTEGEPMHQIENVVLYKAQDSRCPIPMISQGKAGSHSPKCQTVYAHYLLHLHDLDVTHKEAIEEVYVNITRAAIDNGMLEDALDRENPDSVYIVEGAGPLVRPTPMGKPRPNPFHRKRRILSGNCRRQLLKRILFWDNPGEPAGIADHEEMP